MDVDQVVLLGRMTLQEVVLLAGPVLGVAIVVSLAVNIAQVLTSLQDMTISTVARLAATGSALFLLMPWMWRHIANLTISTLSDFQVYLK
ncbi:MAG: flagellar biosynthetic protein FliQ [Terracidiphilus sp.]|jgi:flagellar biosynthesis protein FliQ